MQIRDRACLRLNVITYVVNYHLYAAGVLPAVVFNNRLRVFDDNYDCNNVIERSAAVNCAVANLFVMPRRARCLLVCNLFALPIMEIPIEIISNENERSTGVHPVAKFDAFKYFWIATLNFKLRLSLAGSQPTDRYASHPKAKQQFDVSSHISASTKMHGRREETEGGTFERYWIRYLTIWHRERPDRFILSSLRLTALGALRD